MMNRDKSIKKVSKSRQEYLKFKPFSDDLRKAESWCELDGVLNRYQTVKNLSKMDYRKASEVAREIFAEIEKEIESAIESNYRAKKEHYNHSVIPNYDNFNAMCDGKIYAMRGLLDFIEELKNKYTEGEG